MEPTKWTEETHWTIMGQYTTNEVEEAAHWELSCDLLCTRGIQSDAVIFINKYMRIHILNDAVIHIE